MSINLQPLVESFLWEAEGSNPQGVRHIVSGSPSFIKVLGPTQSGQLDFGRILTSTTSGGLSRTFAVTFRKKQGENEEQNGRSITNVKFWMPFNFSLNGLLDKIQFLYFPSGIWVGSNFLNNTNGYPVPSSLPTSTNILRQDGSGFISSGYMIGNGFTDQDVSQYVYISTQLGTGFTIGDYGFESNSGILFRFTFDYIGVSSVL